MKKVIFSESQIKSIIKKTIEEQELNVDELNYESFTGDERLQVVRDAFDKGKVVSVVFVKKDGTVRYMCAKKFLSSYVASTRDKTEKQMNIESNNDIKRVVDMNIYINNLRQMNGDKAEASKSAWRTINLKDALAFLASQRFIDVREENDIMGRFGEEIYNSLSKSMVAAARENHEDVLNDLQNEQQ